MLEISIALAIFVVLLGLIYLGSGAQGQRSGTAMEQLVLFGQAKRMSKALQNELKEVVTLLFPNAENQSSDYCLVENRNGELVQYYLDRDRNFAKMILPAEQAVPEILIRMPNPKTSIQSFKFTKTPGRALEVYIHYTLLIAGKSEPALEFFDAFSI